MFDPSGVFYMNKIVTGPEAADKIDITAPVKANLQSVAKAKNRSVSDLTVVVLNRPRHDQLVKEIREAGARVKFIQDGDVAAAIEAARPNTSVDLLMGIGGTPEGVITAAAMICAAGMRNAHKKPTATPRATASGSKRQSCASSKRGAQGLSQGCCASCSRLGSQVFVGLAGFAFCACISRGVVGLLMRLFFSKYSRFQSVKDEK
jgi:fructose-1,6-bisphosphatase/sedoheptulose 1,7-bisphosphatase-like protein